MFKCKENKFLQFLWSRNKLLVTESQNLVSVALILKLNFTLQRSSITENRNELKRTRGHIYFHLFRARLKSLWVPYIQSLIRTSLRIRIVLFSEPSNF